MMLNRLFSPLLVALALAVPSVGGAETFRVADDAKFVVRLNVQELQANPLGKLLVDALKSQALAALKEESKDGPQPNLDKLAEILGFDPLQEVQSIVVAGSDYEHPESSLVMRVQLRKTSGNIEGLLLALPGYSSENYGKHVIHLVSPEGSSSFFGAIHSSSTGDKTIFVAVKRDALTMMLDQLENKSESTSASDIELAANKSVVSVRVLSIPTEHLEGPPANLAKIVTQLGVDVRDHHGDVQLEATLMADNEQHAEQLRQMAQGLVAMVELAESVDPEDEDIRKIKEAVHDVKSERTGNQVQIQVVVKSAQVKQLLDEVLKD